jgi:hypothetical protein
MDGTSCLDIAHRRTGRGDNGGGGRTLRHRDTPRKRGNPGVSSTHTLMYQWPGPLCAPEVPQIAEQEHGPTRDPPQPTSSIDMRLHIGNGFSIDAADGARDVQHRPNVYVTDIPRDNSVAP